MHPATAGSKLSRSVCRLEEKGPASRMIGRDELCLVLVGTVDPSRLAGTKTRRDVASSALLDRRRRSVAYAACPDVAVAKLDLACICLANPCLFRSPGLNPISVNLT